MEEVKEKIARLLALIQWGGSEWNITDEGFEDWFNSLGEETLWALRYDADQILKLVRIECKDQSQPHTETAIHRFGEENGGYDEGKDVMYNAMLKAGFVRCLSKEEK